MGVESFKAFQAVTDGEAVERGVVTMSAADLPDDGALVEVHWSSVNYKDGLAATPTGKVARISPIVPGVDLAGVLAEPTGGRPPARPCGTWLRHRRRPPRVRRVRTRSSDWLVPLPEGLSAREAMVVGTAGFTAAMSVIALQEHGVTPAAGPVLVTGATGGVGSTAVGMLAALGYEVVASTGKPDSAEFLTTLGAASVIDRAELAEESPATCSDDMGGRCRLRRRRRPRQRAQALIHYGGSVAASGLTGAANACRRPPCCRSSCAGSTCSASTR